MSPSLLAFVPTRERRTQCETLLESFSKTADDADILFLIDEDDADAYADLEAPQAVMSPKPSSLTEVINNAAMTAALAYDALLLIGDDHVFVTPHWDTIMLDILADMGGTGMVHPYDKLHPGIPGVIMISSDIVRELGHFAEPSLGHFYLNSTWAELGKRSALLRPAPAEVEHRHYSTHPDVERDKTYREAEDTWSNPDAAAYQQWRNGALAMQVALLRRRFNPDTKWVRDHS